MQGWGWEVTSTGYGDLQGGSDKNRWYTDQFNGTSSASPICRRCASLRAGISRAPEGLPASARAINCYGQLARRNRMVLPLHSILHATISKELPHSAARSTHRESPGLTTAHCPASEAGMWVVVQFTGAVPANQTYRWFTYMWPAHWHVVWTSCRQVRNRVGRRSNGTCRLSVRRTSTIASWISITNLTPVPVNIEGRYTVIGW